MGGGRGKEGGEGRGEIERIGERKRARGGGERERETRREKERAGGEKVAHEAGGTEGGNTGVGIWPPHNTYRAGQEALI